VRVGGAPAPGRVAAARHLAHSLAIGNQHIAIFQRRHAPRAVGGKRPQLIAVGVILDDFVQVHVRHQQRSLRGEARVAELAVGAGRYWS